MEKERKKKKNKSTGAEFRDLYAIPLSFVCPIFVLTMSDFLDRMIHHTSSGHIIHFR
jgi:hypothetical protein